MKERFPLPDLLPVVEEEREREGRERERRERRVPTREELGLPKDAFVYVSFNRVMKIEPNIFFSWLRILKRTPNSVLWLLSYPYEAIPNIKKWAEEYGLEKRIIFAEFVPTSEENFVRLRNADVALDCTIWSGHTTSVDALWSALPLVTCVGGCLTYQNGEKEGAKSVNINDFPYEEKGFSLYDEYGDLMGARVAASLLFHLGVTQTIASSRSEYEDIAVKLYEEREFYDSIQTKLIEGRDTSPIFDTRRYIKNFERALLGAW
eukprot:CAMPEP_0201484070 /NCGR_PEP_ID=MMETSP0151_2-20130828/8254_1 /ASSEMBLY_ACC=CAM_ASM_000257 /TAXON_ID=200890 /ORGANISM="Paramoeba atlantica, Strain 621/1 / CCAP 1560/9" /LENGTH=262 /DNA_ID=CAMNT_0047867535 /DNA_START=92 /DNA_END=877 /DNA_ORIENTATION=+